MAKKGRQGFVLFHDIRKPLQKLSDEQRGRLFMAILNYSEFGTEPELDDMATDLAFAFIRQAMDSTIDKWNETSAKRAVAGSVGGKQRAANQAIASFAIEDEANLSKASKSSNIKLEPKLEHKLEPKERRFAKPSVEDVRLYCEANGYQIDPARFVDYYEANGWVQGKGKPIKDWKACVRTWVARDGNKRGRAAEEMQDSYDMMKGWAAS